MTDFSNTFGLAMRNFTTYPEMPDPQALIAYAAQLRRDPEEGVRAYLDRYVYGPKSWSEYLDLLGLEELLDARRRGTGIHDD